MHFVPLSNVFYRLAAFHAFHEFAEQPEGITADDIEAAASYCDKLASYKEPLRLQKRAKAREGVSAPTNQNRPLPREGAVESGEPDCPAIVQHFLNMLVIRGKSINASKMVILERITTCRFPSYVLNETRLATLLTPRDFKIQPAPFRVRNPWRGNELPVYVLDADVKYFVEHGRLKSEDPATTVDQPCTTGQPSPGLDVEPRADDATARDDQPQQAAELSEPADPKSSAVHPDHRGREPEARQKPWTQPRLDYWINRKTEILREPECSHFSLRRVAKKIVKEDAPDHLSDDDKVAWKRKGWTTENILRGIKGRRQSPTSTKKMGQLPPR